MVLKITVPGKMESSNNFSHSVSRNEKWFASSESNFSIARKKKVRFSFHITSTTCEFFPSFISLICLRHEVLLLIFGTGFPESVTPLAANQSSS